MRLIELLKICEQGYIKEFPESSLLEFVDKCGNPNEEVGDLLARHIVREIYETYDPYCSDGQQIDAVIRALDRSQRDINNVIAELEFRDMEEPITIDVGDLKTIKLHP